MFPSRPTAPRHRLPTAAALAALLVVLAPATAQPQELKDPFQFSTNPDRPENLAPAPDLRPNTEQTLYLFVANPTNAAQVMIVELVAGGTSTKVRFPDAPAMRNNQPQWLRVRLPKPPAPAPKPPAPAAPAPPAGAPAGTPAAAAPAEEPPKGVAIQPNAKGEFIFTLKLYLLLGPGGETTPHTTQEVKVGALFPAG